MSVIIPTRNRAALLRDVLIDLQAQDVPTPRLEVIVVDDGSTDQTPDVVRDASESSGGVPITYVRQEGLGINSARNLGVEQARAALLAFVDDDARVPEGWIRELTAGAARHPEAGVFAGRIKLLLEGKPPRWCGRHPLGETELELGDEEKETSNAWGANMIIRRSTFDSVGLFAPEINSGGGDEVELQLRWLRKGGQVVYLPGAWIEHRRRGEDLRLGKMLRGRYWKGRNWVRLGAYVERRRSVVGGLGQIAVGLAHALRRGCAGGLLQAASGLGHTQEAIRLLLHRGTPDHVRWTPDSERRSRPR